MSMKKILMAAVAVSAITAGSASALELKADTSHVGSKALTASAGFGPFEAYSIANEVSVASTSAIAAKFNIATSGNLLPKTEYYVTFTLTGGAFVPPSTLVNATNISFGTAAQASSTAATAIGASTTAGSPAIVIASVNDATAPTQVTFKLTTPDTATTPAGTLVSNLSWLTDGIYVGSAKTPVTVSAKITTVATPDVVFEGGATTPVTIVDYRPGISFAATAANQKLSLASGFKKFVVSAAPDADTAVIGNTVGFTASTGTSTVGGVLDVIHQNLTGTVLTASDIKSAVLTITGDTSVAKLRLGTAQLADVATVPGVFTANPGNLGQLIGKSATISLDTLGTSVGVESDYTVTPVITMTTGLTPATFTAKALGSVKYDGTTIIAPWVSDGVNGINYSIRLGNKSTSTAITTVSASLLNPATTGTSGTVASTGLCPLGSIAAKGELVISSENLKTCFGAFKRSDVRLTIQSPESQVTAKMRATAAGVQTEASLGSGVTTSAANN